MISEEWGIAYDRIYEYLSGESFTQADNKTFRFGDCLVIVQRMAERELGRARLPRTLVSYDEKAKSAAEFRQAFLMRFMSAGG